MSLGEVFGNRMTVHICFSIYSRWGLLV